MHQCKLFLRSLIISCPYLRSVSSFATGYDRKLLSGTHLFYYQNALFIYKMCKIQPFAIKAMQNKLNRWDELQSFTLNHN